MDQASARLVVVALVTTAAAAPSPRAQDRPPCPPAFFAGVGDLPGGDDLSSARDVSASGERVVGSSAYADGSPHVEQAFGWVRPCEPRPFWPCLEPGGRSRSAGSGIFALGIPLDAARAESGASGIAPDGRAVAGYANEGPDSAPRAVVWQPIACGRALLLDRLPGHVMARAIDVGDPVPHGGTLARIVAGYSSTANQHAHRTPGAAPVWWTSAGPDVHALPLPPGFAAESAEVRALSDDGAVLAGILHDFTQGRLAACVWELGAPGEYAASLLADLAGGADSSAALGVSGDGSTVVGWGTASAGTQPVLWRRGASGFGLPVALPLALASGESAEEGQALAVDADGSVVAGSVVLDGAFTAARWSVDASGAAVAETVLAHLLARAVPVPPDWHVFYVARVSADGSTLVGEGLAPDGAVEGWVAGAP